MEKLINEIAAEFRVATREVQAIDPVRDRLAAGGIDLAYAVQEANTKHGLENGRRLVGRKIGLTSPAVQMQLGVDQPDFGMLFADMERYEGIAISRDGLVQPKIEAEAAFILGQDLTKDEPTIADVLTAIAYVVPAFEIVDSRIRDWNIQIVDTVADNASSGLYVLGGPARRITDLDLRSMRMILRDGDKTVSQGQGSACLGSPLNAMRWLAGEMARRARPLRAGDVVLSGALGPMVPVRSGATYEAEIEGLGRVTATFEGGDR